MVGRKLRKWDASKPGIEISMGCALFPLEQIQAERPGISTVVVKGKWNAYFPFGNFGLQLAPDNS